MNTQTLIQSYRLFDVACGILETNERIRSDLVAIRQQQMALQKKSLTERALLVFAALVTMVPILDEYISENPYKILFISMFALTLIVYLIFTLMNFREETIKAVDIENELKNSPTIPIEESSIFISMRASMYVTRRSIAREIVVSTESDEGTKNKFNKIVEHWQSRINDLREHVKKLYEEKKLTKEVYERIIEWLS